jgi:division protein CdvB (Snf7/Vps24/ESCRT-III family)
MLAVGPILSIVQETKGRLVGIVPSIADKLGEINTVLDSSMAGMGSFNSSKVSTKTSEIPIKINEETVKILEEANEAAAEKIRDRFPQLPMEFEIQEKPKEARIPVALTGLGGQGIDLTKINDKKK